MVQEDADAVGLSMLSGAHLSLVPKVIDALGAAGRGDVLVIVGGIIPDDDIPRLTELGVAAVFTPGVAAAVDRPVARRRARPARGGARRLRPVPVSTGPDRADPREVTPTTEARRGRTP